MNFRDSFIQWTNILCDKIVSRKSKHKSFNKRRLSHPNMSTSGADPGFQVRRGGALKKTAPNGGRCENFWGISCEKSRFYAKKSYFFQF